jgi:hypothetical protein
MNQYLTHQFAQAREADVRRQTASVVIDEMWVDRSETVGQRLGLTLVHMGARLMDRTAVVRVERLARAA